MRAPALHPCLAVPAAGLCLLLLLALPARAGIESLVMPGPVITGHADIEDDCGQCHAPFQRGAEDRLCLACHDDVDADVRAKKGFHGQAPGITGTPCRSCHSDHKGRDADVVGLNPELFDHTFTDYPLHGAHQGVACEQCHATGEKHRDAPSLCVDCHEDADPHKGNLGRNCGDCHDELAWTRTEFDHSQTDFPLLDAHAEVTCALCHANERYEDTPADCATCHVLDDVHQGRFGPKCQDCHDVKRWQNELFDHDRDTKYPLTGKHEQVTCASCHTGTLYQEDLGTDCVSCHKPDDVHQGQRGDACGRCHRTSGWGDDKFDHDRDTEFPLRGKHGEVLCEACHTGTMYAEEDLGQDCFSCHEGVDVHGGQQGQSCGTCHGERSWKTDVVFDHDITRFPLLGLHATVACEECHETARYRDTEATCIACHRDGDTHEATLGETCGACHNPNGWAIWRFDHDADTTFALHGKHEGVDCRSCHTDAVAGATHEIELGADCAGCHAHEDVHRGQFGRDCARCHGEKAWSELKPAALGR